MISNVLGFIDFSTNYYSKTKNIKSLDIIRKVKIKNNISTSFRVREREMNTHINILDS